MIAKMFSTNFCSVDLMRFSLMPSHADQNLPIGRLLTRPFIFSSKSLAPQIRAESARLTGFFE